MEKLKISGTYQGTSLVSHSFVLRQERSGVCEAWGHTQEVGADVLKVSL